jgi:hypothetical protein
MKKAIIALSICIAAAPLAVLAQGEVGAVKKAPDTSMKASKEERAAAKSDRKMEGAAAAKTPTPGEVGPMKGQPPNTSGSTESRAAVKSEAKAANKAGEADKGGQVGPTK